MFKRIKRTAIHGCSYQIRVRGGISMRFPQNYKILIILFYCKSNNKKCIISQNLKILLKNILKYILKIFLSYNILNMIFYDCFSIPSVAIFLDLEHL